VETLLQKSADVKDLERVGTTLFEKVFQTAHRKDLHHQEGTILYHNLVDELNESNTRRDTTEE